MRRTVSALLLIGALVLLAVPGASAQYCSFGPGRGFYSGAYGTPIYGDLPYSYYPYYPVNSYGSYYPYYGAPLYGGFGGYGGTGAVSVGGPATYPYYPFSGAGYYPYPAGVGFGTAQPLSLLQTGQPYIGNGLPVGFGGIGYGTNGLAGIGGVGGGTGGIGGYPSSFSTTGLGGYTC